MGLHPKLRLAFSNDAQRTFCGTRRLTIPMNIENWSLTKGIRELMDDHLHRGRTLSGRLLRLLMFELWYRNFLERYVFRSDLRSLSAFSQPRERAQDNSELASTPL
jgi:hypothetical protein